MKKLADYFDGDNYIQQNPQISDQIWNLGKALEEMANAGITIKYDTIHKIL